MSVVIKIENVSKKYQLGLIGTKTLKGDIQRWWYRMRGLPDPTLMVGQENILSAGLLTKDSTRSEEYIWALKDINFQVEQGEVLGIIGKNGAGKSTLLKLLSRVTAPTTGSIKVKGRIASLLEVGTGFHPELTGLENIFLNGAILGMNKYEIGKKLDEIVDFAGIAKYIDTPVKRYSSGMYVRLAFAVAAHLEPEILIVDEVLAVGDAEFQKKAIGKMQDVSRNNGRTVLFVSHNMGAIEQLCSTALIIDQGTIIEKANDVTSIINSYLINNIKENKYITPKKEIADGQIILKSCYTKNEKSEKDTFVIDEQIYLVLEVYYKKLVKDVFIGVALVDKYERRVLISEYDLKLSQNLDVDGTKTVSMKLPQNILAPGIYSFQIGLHIPNQYLFEYLTGISKFEITPLKSKFSNLPYEAGLININCVWV